MRVLLLLALVGLAAATTRYVATTGADSGTCDDQASPCLSLSFAIQVASTTDTISLGDGTYTGDKNVNLTITKDLTFVSTSGTGPETVIIDAAGTVPVFASITSVVSISTMTLKNGNNAGNWGGCVYVQSGRFDASSVVFDSCSSDHGGGVFYDLTAGTIADSQFLNCKSANDGGAVSVKSPANVAFTNVQFVNNTAAGSGGGAAIIGSGNSTTFDSCHFTMNSCGSGSACTGGGLFIQGVGVTVTKSFFTMNIANAPQGGDGSAGGGAAVTYGGTTSSQSTFTSCSFDSNQAATLSGATGGRGGGLAVLDGSVGVTLSTFTNNNANSGGALVFAPTSSSPPAVPPMASLHTCNISSNTALLGGGIYIIAPLSPYFYLVTIHNNHAVGANDDAHGGGVSVVNPGANPSTAKFTECTFDSNDSQGYGGGIVIHKSALVIEGSSAFFKGNSAQKGGAVYTLDSDTSTFTGVKFYQNTAAQGGGAWVDSSHTEFDACHFNNNFATGDDMFTSQGGALYIGSSDGAPVFNSVYFEANHANGVNGAGGGAYVSGGYPNFTICTFEQNTAMVEGAALTVASTLGHSKMVTLSGGAILNNQLFKPNPTGVYNGTGYIGGQVSSEFPVLTFSGGIIVDEACDLIRRCDQCLNNHHHSCQARPTDDLSFCAPTATPGFASNCTAPPEAQKIVFVLGMDENNFVGTDFISAVALYLNSIPDYLLKIVIVVGRAEKLGDDTFEVSTSLAGGLQSEYDQLLAIGELSKTQDISFVDEFDVREIRVGSQTSGPITVRDDENAKHPLGPGAIAGITIAVVLSVMAIAFFIWWRSSKGPSGGVLRAPADNYSSMNA